MQRETSDWQNSVQTIAAHQLSHWTSWPAVELVSPAVGCDVLGGENVIETRTPWSVELTTLQIREHCVSGNTNQALMMNGRAHTRPLDSEYKVSAC